MIFCMALISKEGCGAGTKVANLTRLSPGNAIAPTKARGNRKKTQADKLRFRGHNGCSSEMLSFCFGGVLAK